MDLWPGCQDSSHLAQLCLPPPSPPTENKDKNRNKAKLLNGEQLGRVGTTWKGNPVNVYLHAAKVPGDHAARPPAARMCLYFAAVALLLARHTCRLPATTHWRRIPAPVPVPAPHRTPARAQEYDTGSPSCCSSSVSIVLHTLPIECPSPADAPLAGTDDLDRRLPAFSVVQQKL
ncbi:hypothetical protein CKAH01_06017 [Colletotrichum kahawae]|uniref:Uncharacterized protein n=1 Tax=Colletotrichum kahawae TaxID=34407 RepID=A0AAD9YBI4_COLKA|nr:hypothetical protein CKAH01_06017 [Colletotrichum kahawae]